MQTPQIRPPRVLYNLYKTYPGFVQKTRLQKESVRAYWVAGVLAGEAHGQFWRRAIGASEFRRIGADWDVIDNPGIRFGGPIKEQGAPWEDHLENRHSDKFERLHPNFKTFDFQTRDRETAISAKTLNINALTYQRRPTAIFGRLKRYVDQVERFDNYDIAGDEVISGTLKKRTLELAVPQDATATQLFEIQRAIDYAVERGIELNVTLIRGG